MRSVCLALAAMVAGGLSAQSLQFRMMHDRFVPDHFGIALPFGLDFADVDGDGDPDLHVATGSYQASGGQDLLYLNDGRGVFDDVTATNLAIDNRQTIAALFVDVDGDGDSDLVHGNTPYVGASGQNRLFLNVGTGVFVDVTTTNFPADQDSTQAMDAGDVDGDGDMDLVVGNQGGYKLYLNNGPGVFIDATGGRLQANAFYPVRAILVDLDGDVDLDLVACNGGSLPGVRTYVNDGSGVFTDQTGMRVVGPVQALSDAAMFDADGDGDADLVVVSRTAGNRFYRNVGGVLIDSISATFAARGDELLTAGDVDGDGDADLVVARHLLSFDSETALLLNDGTGNFTAAPPGRLPLLHGDTGAFGGLALADVDADSDLDLMLQGRAPGRLSVYGSAERLLLNDGSGAFSRAGGVELPASARSIALGDFDRDGRPDVLLAGRTVALFRNDGKRRFTDITPPSLSPQAEVSEALVEDFDGDGNLDLFLARGTATSLQSQLWLGDGTGALTDVTASNLPAFLARTWHAAVGDVDGDRDPDIVMSNRLQGNRLLLNDGTGGFAIAANLSGRPTSGEPVALADFDGDGDLDLLEGTSLSENRGSGVFTPRANLSGLASGTIPLLRVGDLDGDGWPDILVCHWNVPNQIAINRGPANPWTFAMTSLPVGGSRAGDASLFDMDVDGDLDMVIVGGRNGTLFENLGGGQFGLASDRWYLRRQSQVIAVGDLDRDGDPDLVEGAGRVCNVYYNLHLHHAVPDPADPGARYRVEVSYHPGYLAQARQVVLLLATREAEVWLRPVGVLGVDPAASVTLGFFTLPAPAGTFQLDLFVPNSPSLSGLRLWSQALFIDPTLPWAPVRLDGALGDTIR